LNPGPAENVDVKRRAGTTCEDAYVHLLGTVKPVVHSARIVAKGAEMVKRFGITNFESQAFQV